MVRVTDVRYKEHRIYDGKPKLEGLPSTYVENDLEAKTLEIDMEDKLIGLTITLTYTVFKDFNVITRSVIFENIGCENIKFGKVLSATVDFRDEDFELNTLYGAHTNEKNIARRHIVPGIQMIESCRGASSPQQAPF